MQAGLNNGIILTVTQITNYNLTSYNKDDFKGTGEQWRYERFEVPFTTHVC